MPHEGVGVLLLHNSACCVLLSLHAAAEVRGRQSWLRVVMQSVKVDRSGANLENECKMHLVHLYLQRQLLQSRTV